jgi:acyl-CoA synthetase (AMP-forming)/AMP-acid ligase II
VVSTLPRWLDPRRPGLRRASAGALEPRYDRDVSPLPGAVKIVQPGTEDLAAHGETGELCTRGYHVMAGQFDDPGQTAAAIDEDGWLRTGDLASMDEQGYCRIDGRLKDPIIRGAKTSTRAKSNRCCSVTPMSPRPSCWAYPIRGGANKSRPS